jgi:hypothetical protein
MGSEAMAQGMRCNVLGDSSGFGGLIKKRISRNSKNQFV